MQLGQLIMDVGSRIAALCDRYVARRRSQQQQEHAASLAQVLLSSRCPKGRLLHYFPLTEADLAAGAQDNPDQWCGWHKDHGSLTGAWWDGQDHLQAGVMCRMHALCVACCLYTLC